MYVIYIIFLNFKFIIQEIKIDCKFDESIIKDIANLRQPV